MGERLYGQRPRTGEEVGRSASGMDGVEVLRVIGTSTHDGDGVDVVVRTSGSAYNGWLDAEEVTVRRCFAVRVSPKSEWREDPRDVACPDGPALTFAPPPEPPRLPYEELRARLPRVPEGGRVDEAEVRRTLAALDLHPAVSHFFRLWLWLTTGMVTKEWAAVYRKHHAKVETSDDPHSPQVLGLNRVLWGGVLLYVKATRDPQTIERYGQGTPDDWLERHVYSQYARSGITLMGIVDVAVFGIVPGALILITQLFWIPFWAAGVIKGIGHYWGYRHWSTPDASTNIMPVGILIGGEELHNNHHAYPTSAKLSSKWYEFDIGWLYIRLL